MCNNHQSSVDVSIVIVEIFKKKFPYEKETDEKNFTIIGTCGCGADLYCGIISYYDSYKRIFSSSSIHFCANLDCDKFKKKIKTLPGNCLNGLMLVDICPICNHYGKLWQAKMIESQQESVLVH